MFGLLLTRKTLPLIMPPEKGMLLSKHYKYGDLGYGNITGLKLYLW